MRLGITGLVLSVAITAACSKRDVPVLEPAAEEVEIVNAAPPGCKALGDVDGRSTSNIDRADAIEGARNDLRNQTADLGGTHVELQQSSAERDEVVLVGQAYCCPGRKARC